METYPWGSEPTRIVGAGEMWERDARGGVARRYDGSSDGSSGTERALDVEEHSSELSFADGKVHFIEISK
jgi:hypothetical protein